MIDHPELAKLNRRLSFDKRKRQGASEPFRTQEFLINRAQVVPAPNERSTVSAFSGWIFDLCHEPRGDRQHALFLGKLAERVLRRSHRIPKATSGENLELLFQEQMGRAHLKEMR